MKPEPRELPRRFYKNVEVEETPEGFKVRLDGRALKTPAKRTLSAPTAALASLIAEEWRVQGEVIDPETMPATRIVNVAIDRIDDTRAALAEEAASYASTDLVCYLADDDPNLAQHEETVWAPLRVWAAETLGIALEPVAGIVAREQPAASLTAARDRALELDDIGLAAFAHAMGLLGSAVLAFALLHGRLDSEAAFAASRLDEAYQETRWGVDAEAAARAERLAADLAALEAVMRARLT